MQAHTFSSLCFSIDPHFFNIHIQMIEKDMNNLAMISHKNEIQFAIGSIILMHLFERKKMENRLLRR
jgi:hypothetical protein